jgi:uncharacterized protein
VRRRGEACSRGGSFVQVTEEANVATLRAGYDALNRGDLSRVMALIDDEITWDPGPLTPDAGDTSSSGPAGFESLIRSWIDAFDDFRIEPLDVVEDGPYLVATVRQSGTGRGSGVDIAIEIAHVWTVRDGRAVRLESYANAGAAFEAIQASRDT